MSFRYMHHFGCEYLYLKYLFQILTHSYIIIFETYALITIWEIVFLIFIILKN